MRGDQSRDQGGADFAAMHVRSMQPRSVVPGLLKVGGLERDQGAELPGVLDREVEHDAPADRAAHDDRPVELHGPAEGADGGRIGLRGQAVLATLPAIGRRRLAVPGHVERQHAEAPGDFRIGQQVAVLAVVGARRMQANKRNAAPRFFEIETMSDAFYVGSQVTAGHGVELGCHVRPLSAAGRAGP